MKIRDLIMLNRAIARTYTIYPHPPGIIIHDLSSCRDQLQAVLVKLYIKTPEI